MQKEDSTAQTTRKRAPKDEPDWTQVAERIAAVMENKETPHDAKVLLEDALDEMWTEAGFQLYSPEIIRLTFALVASINRPGYIQKRNSKRGFALSMLEIIEAGEDVYEYFKGYTQGTGKWGFQRKSFIEGYLKYYNREARQAGIKEADDTINKPKKAADMEAREAWIKSQANDSDSSEAGEHHIIRKKVGSDLEDYGIQPADQLCILTDGDVENNELAVWAWNKKGKTEVFWTCGFLTVHDEKFCQRLKTILECEDLHYEIAQTTIVGRVVAVERSGLPVKVKCDLRPLQFAG